jgi:hypothetical protein
MGWGDAQGGRPRKLYVRRRVDYPPPNPQPTPCRIWQGSVDRFGYGRVLVHTTDHKRRQMTASRWVWTMANGPIPKGLVVRHKCDNPPCFRLSHLELGTLQRQQQRRRRARSPSDADLSGHPQPDRGGQAGPGSGASYPQDLTTTGQRSRSWSRSAGCDGSARSWRTGGFPHPPARGLQSPDDVRCQTSPEPGEGICRRNTPPGERNGAP